jgi:hypothetical protein
VGGTRGVDQRGLDQRGRTAERLAPQDDRGEQHGGRVGVQGEGRYGDRVQRECAERRGPRIPVDDHPGDPDPGRRGRPEHQQHHIRTAETGVRRERGDVRVHHLVSEEQKQRDGRDGGQTRQQRHPG